MSWNAACSSSPVARIPAARGAQSCPLIHLALQGSVDPSPGRWFIALLHAATRIQALVVAVVTKEMYASERDARAAIEQLHRDHGAAVLRLALRDLTNRADAEDATQDAFMEAFRALERGSQPFQPRQWLLAIAQNVVRRRFRNAHHPRPGSMPNASRRRNMSGAPIMPGTFLNLEADQPAADSPLRGAPLRRSSSRARA